MLLKLVESVQESVWQQIFCRNNLNKIAMTLLNPKDDWAVDAWCGGGKDGDTLILDIHPLPQRDFPGADKFEYYGYK